MVDGLTRIAGALARSYAQVLFSRSPQVGALLILATMAVPRVGLAGLASGALALGVAAWAGLSPADRDEGLFSYNAVLIGLGVGAMFEPGVVAGGVLVAGAVLGVVLSAALQGLLTARTGLPQLSIAFQVGLWLTAAAAGAAGVYGAPAETALPLLDLPAPVLVERSLEALGALFFLPRWDVGLLVLAALTVHSRIAAMLAVLGLAASGPFAAATADTWATSLHGTLAFNLVLTAIALGGTWFVPSGSSVLLALGGCLVAATLTFGLAQPLLATGLPVRVLPFNLAVLLVLGAMRLRVRDGAPKSVDFLLGSPEQNLRTWRTRVARFGATYIARFHAPFRGRWSITQGTDGEHTHQGVWRHAADFEVMGRDGEPMRAPATRNDHAHCWRLPVVACADGTVAAVLDGAPDKPVGEVDLHDNWGNAVILWHGGLVWSMVGHLAAGSVAVRTGQVVKQGETLGLCGSSGRSPRPHLHFQLQSAATPGAPTIPLELHDVIRVGEDGEELLATVTPGEGETLRNIEPQPDVAAAFRFTPDEVVTFRVDDQRDEPLTARIDLLGRMTLSTDRPEATLYYHAGPRLFVIYDVLGRGGTVLDLVRLALPRVPLEASPRLHWVDTVPGQVLLSPMMQSVLQPVYPLFAGRGERMRYRMSREGRRLTVRGASERKAGDGPALVTTAVLEVERGLVEVRVASRGKERVAVRI